MASIYRRKKGGCFYITYQARPGERHTVKGGKNRAATEALARKLEADAMLRREGIIDTQAEKLAHTEFLPLEKHLETFETAMRGKGGTPEHVDRALIFIRDFPALCRFKNLAGLDAARIAACVTDLKRDSPPSKEGSKKRRPLSARAVNARLTALKSFTRWLFRTERMRTDPMMQVAKLNVSSDRRRIRRALLDEEVTRLIQAAEKGPVVRDMTGPERAMLYRLAVETGLRAAELASLTPASFHLADLDAATVKVTAAYSKHRRDDVLPLRRDRAVAVAVFIAGKSADARVSPLGQQQCGNGLVIRANRYVERCRAVRLVFHIGIGALEQEAADGEAIPLVDSVKEAAVLPRSHEGGPGHGRGRSPVA